MNDIESLRPMMRDLIEAAEEKRIQVSAPLPSSLAMEDTEIIRAYVDAKIRQACEEWFDKK